MVACTVEECSVVLKRIKCKRKNVAERQVVLVVNASFGEHSVFATNPNAFSQ